MFRQLSFAVLLLALGQVAYGQNIMFGSCPEVEVAEGFNVTKFAGEWFQQYSIPIYFAQDTKCTRANYTVINGNTIAIDKSQILLDNDNQPEELEKSEGIATENQSGILETAFVREEYRPVSYEMKVLGFSDDYIVLYSGVYQSLMCYNNIWIVTKQQHPSAAVLSAAVKHITANGLRTKELKREDQSNCTL